jgi:integrase
MGYVEDLRGKKQGRGRPRWRARYRDLSGRERAKSFARKIDAERFLVGIEDAKLRGAYVDPAAGKVAFGEWAERWYNTTAALRHTTRRDYRKLLDQQVLPAFGEMTLAGIDALAVREWVAGLVAGGLSAKHARKAHAVLRQVLASAVEGGRLSRNVAAGMKLPKVQRTEMHFLDAEQVEALAETIDPRYATLIRFAAYSGLRPSELTALRVGRLDLLRRSARVVEAAPEIDGRLHWGGVKTTSRAPCGCPGRSPRNWPPTSLAALVILRRWCSPRRWVARCVRTPGSRASSSRRSARPGCPRGCGCTTCGIPARRC